MQFAEIGMVAWWVGVLAPAALAMALAATGLARQRVVQRIAALAWSVGLLAPAGMCIVMVWVSTRRWGIDHAWEAWIVAMLATLASIWCLSSAVVAFFRTPTKRLLKVTAAIGTAAVLCLPICRALLPWEAPGTGEGSPLATLLGIILMTAIGIPLVVTGLVIAGWVLVPADTRPRQRLANFKPSRPA